MKSFIVRMVGLGRSAAFAVAISVAFVSTVSFADDGVWFLDSSSSDAIFFQGSAENPFSLNTGVARVTGIVSLGTDLDHSVVELSIFPADEDWGHTLILEGHLPTSYVPDASDNTLLTFKSKRILNTMDGRLEILGDLTLTRVERSISIIPSDAYAGPVYGDPVIHTETHEATFLFPNPSSHVSPGPLTATLQTNSSLELLGSTRINYESFPQLLSAIKDTNWPAIVKDEQCQMPSTIGEDYSGARCTGTVVAAVNNANCQMPATVGEDYSGPICTPPAGDETTIVLDLKLLPTGSESGPEMLSAAGSNR